MCIARRTNTYPAVHLQSTQDHTYPAVHVYSTQDQLLPSCARPQHAGPALTQLCTSIARRTSTYPASCARPQHIVIETIMKTSAYPAVHVHSTQDQHLPSCARPQHIVIETILRTSTYTAVHVHHRTHARPALIQLCTCIARTTSTDPAVHVHHSTSV